MIFYQVTESTPLMNTVDMLSMTALLYLVTSKTVGLTLDAGASFIVTFVLHCSLNVKITDCVP